MQEYELLERELALWEGVGELGSVAVCNSGTSAIQLALQALGLPKGSRVIVPTFTFVACARAVKMAGLEPVFVDCGDDGLVTSQLIQQTLDTSSIDTQAIMLVHVYGRKAQVVYFTEPGFPLTVIEDLAEAHGVVPYPDSDAACFSFYQNKIIAGEEGGAVVFRHREQADKVRILRNQGHPASDDTWLHIPGAGNYRLANSLAAKIRMSLANFERNIKARRVMEFRYELCCPDGWKMPYRDAPWVYDLRIPGMTRQKQDDVIDELTEAGIAVRRGFRPLHTLEEFKNCLIVSLNRDDVASRLFREVICLPLLPLDQARAERAFDVIKHVVG